MTEHNSMATTEHDWPEDFGSDNGRYWNQCVFCSQHFQGHKYRRVCRRCALDPSWFRAVRLLNWLGIVTPRTAKAAGFTHHCRLFGLLPCYYRDDPPDGCMIEMKWRPLWLLERPLLVVWVAVWVVCGDGEPEFGMKLGKEL